jgi:hypothetical protein
MLRQPTLSSAPEHIRADILTHIRENRSLFTREARRDMLKDDSRKNLEKYWQLSVDRFRAADFALAAFFAITLIEEVGKVVILENASLGVELDRNGFYSHPEKYIYMRLVERCRSILG